MIATVAYHPGIHDNVPRPIYDALDGVNFSRLKLFDRTPAHACHDLLHQADQTEAMRFGTALHMAVFEPAEFERQVAKVPVVDKRTKKGKQLWGEFIHLNPTKLYLSAQDFDACLRIGENLLKSPGDARELLDAGGERERTMVWSWEKYYCKARLDLMCRWRGQTVIADLKSTQSASEAAFARSIANYHYHAQAAFYLDGADTLAPADRAWAWIVVEKEPPYLHAVYEPSAQMLEQGRRLYQRWMQTWKECSESGAWPGYDSEVREIELPRWAQE